MGLTAPFKLAKLTVVGYSQPNRSATSRIKNSFEAMFNPESFKEAYQIRYGKNQGINTSRPTAKYARSDPTELTLQLLLDGTGVDQLGLFALAGPKTVSERVDDFLQLAYHMNGEIHEPNYLLVEWGRLIFPCRLGGVEINYTSFGRDGKPLRATLDVTFISDTDIAKRQAKENKQSPDLTHKRMVKSGDTLPLLTRSVYGTADDYLLVARFNELDDFRNLTPGQELLFPPLDRQP